MVQVDITPNPTTVGVTLARQLTATAIFSDGTSMDVTTTSMWQSQQTQFAIVDATGLVTGVAAGTATITATAGGVVGSVTVDVTPATVSTVEVAPATATLAAGSTLPLTATATLSDGSILDVTAQATWSTNNAAAATVTPGGTARGMAAGNATITATYGGVGGTATVTVTSATLTQIVVEPAAPTLAMGTSVALTATGIFSDGLSQDLTAQVVWSSQTPGVAAVGTTGLLTTVSPGQSVISAALGLVTGSTAATVTNAVLQAVDVFPLDVTLAVGTNQQFTAVGTFSDGSIQDVTAQVTWTVVVNNGSTAPVASVTPGGLVTASNDGLADVTATLSGVSGSASLTVTTATLVSLQVTPALPIVARQTSLAFTATGTLSDGTIQDMTTSVTWSSQDQAVATISNTPPNQGVATGVSAGSSVITAAFGAVTGNTTLTVTNATLTAINVLPSSARVPVGFRAQFRAQGVFDDGTTQDITTLVTWTSSNTAALSISNTAGTQGQASGVAVGGATVTAQRGLLQGSATASVVAATLLSIAVTPIGPENLPVGQTLQMTAVGTFQDNTTPGGGTFTLDITTQVKWASSRRRFVSTNASGLVRARRLGSGMQQATANITASRNRVTSNAVTINVVP